MKEFDSGDDDDERSGAEKDTGKKKNRKLESKQKSFLASD